MNKIFVLTCLCIATFSYASYASYAAHGGPLHASDFPAGSGSGGDASGQPPRVNIEESHTTRNGIITVTAAAALGAYIYSQVRPFDFQARADVDKMTKRYTDVIAAMDNPKRLIANLGIVGDKFTRGFWRWLWSELKSDELSSSTRRATPTLRGIAKVEFDRDWLEYYIQNNQSAFSDIEQVKALYTNLKEIALKARESDNYTQLRQTDAHHKDTINAHSASRGASSTGSALSGVGSVLQGLAAVAGRR